MTRCALTGTEMVLPASSNTLNGVTHGSAEYCPRAENIWSGYYQICELVTGEHLMPTGKCLNLVCARLNNHQPCDAPSSCFDFAQQIFLWSACYGEKSCEDLHLQLSLPSRCTNRKVGVAKFNKTLDLGAL